MADMMNMEDDDEPDFTGPLAQAGAMPQGALTPEQMQMPDNIRQMFESGRKMFEGANFGDIEARNRAAIEQKREALRRGREMLMAQKPDNTALLLALAQGFLSPTRSGSFFESLGNAGGAAIPAVNAMNQQRRQREQGLADFDVRAADLESDATKSEYDLLLKRAGLGQRQMQTAAQIDARRQQQLAAQNAAAERDRARRDAAAERERARREDRGAANERDRWTPAEITLTEEEAAAESRRLGVTVPPGPNKFLVDRTAENPAAARRWVGSARPTAQWRVDPNDPNIQINDTTGERKPVNARRANEGRLPKHIADFQRDTLEAISVASSTVADIDPLLKSLDEGKLNLGAISNMVSAGRNMAGISNDQSQAYADFRTFVEKLRNDTLRLNKGVQTEGDAQRELNSLFNSLNDSKVVARHLRRIQEINRRAVALQRMQLDQARRSSGFDPLSDDEYNQFVLQAPASGDAPPPRPEGAPAPAAPGAERWERDENGVLRRRSN